MEGEQHSLLAQLRGIKMLTAGAGTVSDLVYWP